MTVSMTIAGLRRLCMGTTVMRTRGMGTTVMPTRGTRTGT